MSEWPEAKWLEARWPEAREPERQESQARQESFVLRIYRVGRMGGEDVNILIDW